MSKLVKVDPIKATVEDPVDETGPEVGQWYWVEYENRDHPLLECVVHVGSNYVRFEGVGGGTTRVHFDEFDGITRREHDPDSHIDERIAQLVDLDD